MHYWGNLQLDLYADAPIGEGGDVQVFMRTTHWAGTLTPGV